MKKLLCAVALVGTLAVPGALRAQFTLGPVGAYHDDLSAVGIGAYAAFAVPSLNENLSINPSFIYYFPDSPLNAWELSGDVVYAFEVAPDTPVLPFAMAGINILHESVDNVTGSGASDTGFQLGGGIGFRAQSIRPFVGGKFEFHDGNSFVLFGGIGFTVGP